MAYFNYHAKIKKSIKCGSLVSFYISEKYKKIGKALVLVFDDGVFPIREYRFFEYFELIESLYFIKENKGVFYCSFRPQS